MTTARSSLRALAARGPALFYLVLGGLYAALTVAYIAQAGLFDYLAVDYRAFRATAAIVAQHGFAAAYDPVIQEAFQRPLYDAYALGSGRALYATAPMYYLPAFLPLLAPLRYLSPVAGFVAWTALSTAALGLYLGRLARAWPGSLVGGVLPAVLLSYPFFLTLFLGQVNVWLLICLGEWLLASQRGQPVRAGLWLAGLLLKPQALILLLPALLLGRRWPTLAGFAAAGTALLGLSLALVGLPGLATLARLALFYGTDATTAPQLMMNWRSLAANLAPLLPPALAWGPAIVGLVLTVPAALSFWRRPDRGDETAWALAALGTYAATCAVAWHAHVHMALPLLVPLLFLAGRGRLPPLLLHAWAGGPALVFFTTAFFTTRAPNLAGLAMLGLNLGLVAWALRARPLDESPEMATMAGMRNSTDKEP